MREPIKAELPEALLWRWPGYQPGGDPFIPWILATGSENERTGALTIELELQKSILEAKLKAVGQVQQLVARK